MNVVVLSLYAAHINIHSVRHGTLATFMILYAVISRVLYLAR